MGKNLLLIDYENVQVTLTNKYKLEITKDGIKHLLRLNNQFGTIEMDDVYVAAYWKFYPMAKDLFDEQLVNIIDVREKGKDVSDGYLIVEGTLIFNDQIKEIDQVIIIGGDSVYTALANKFLQKGKIVNIIGWEESISGIYKVHSSLKLTSLESLFTIDKHNNHLRSGWFKGIHHITNPENGMINFALKKDYPHLFVHDVANRLFVNTTDKRYSDLDTFEKALDFVESCIAQGIFTEIDRQPGSKDGEPIRAMVVNYDNPKVQKIKLSIENRNK